jgi:hypothetical protein
MSHIDAFRALPEQLSLEEKRALYRLFISNPGQGILKVMDLAARHGLDLSAAEVAELIAEVDQDDRSRDVSWEEALPTKKIQQRNPL